MSEDIIYQKYADLADGETLLTLKCGCGGIADREGMASLLACLRESFVRIPVSVTMSEYDEKRLQEAVKHRNAENFVARDEVRMRPDVQCSNDGRRWFVMFSNETQIPKAYGRNFTVFEEAVPNCIAMAKAMDGLNGLVLDPFTEPFLIPFDMAETILQMQEMHKH